MSASRTILHVDLDAFYASVEQRDDPTLRGRPVIVGGHERRGVVCAASYEARRFGVRSALPMARALALCPQAVVLRPRMEHYAAVSDSFFSILDRYSPQVEGLSLDEAFLDGTGEERLLGDGPAIARAIKDAVRGELGLVVSVGVAPSKFVAKIASDLEKPDGLVVVPADGVRAFLAPLPLARLWGVGQVTETRLADLGLRTIGDVAAAGEARLRAALGKESARHLAALAAGIDPRAVEPDRAAVSVGHEDTFLEDLHDRELLGVHLLGQADRVCERLRHAGLRARTLTVKVKYASHDLVTRRRTLATATADGRVVGREALSLLAAVTDVERRGVRLTGVSASGLEPEGRGQLVLGQEEVDRGERLGRALDRIHEKFGAAVVRRAIHVGGSAHEEPVGVTSSRRPRRE